MIYALAYEDERLWLGSYQEGLYAYDMANKELTHYYQGSELNSISDNLIYDILIDSQQRIWIATNNGLNMLDKNTSQFKFYFKEKNNYQQLASNTIRTLFEDS